MIVRVLPSALTVADPRTWGLPTRVISPPESAKGFVTSLDRSKETGFPTLPSRSTTSETVIGGRVDAITVTGMVMFTGSVDPSCAWTTTEAEAPTGVPVGTEMVSSCPDTLA